MESLLGDPAVMAYYDHPKSRSECQECIDWNKRNYARDGFGLWIIETEEGEFIGDCGLTWQPVDGQSLEVGYHVLPRYQGMGFATAGAQAALTFARDSHVDFVIAIIEPANAASIRVAEKAGLAWFKVADHRGRQAPIYRADLRAG